MSSRTHPADFIVYHAPLTPPPSRPRPRIKTRNRFFRRVTRPSPPPSSKGPAHRPQRVPFVDLGERRQESPARRRRRHPLPAPLHHVAAPPLPVPDEGARDREERRRARRPVPLGLKEGGEGEGGKSVHPFPDEGARDREERRGARRPVPLGLVGGGGGGGASVSQSLP